ncbi:MAG TPA: hypothetical protein DCL35_03380 [Candidatus Omnitrophica bacterium]|nr:hypothetical protein [Candidatus Omnitrophota bacterium]
MPLKVLIIEDEKSVYELLVLFLEKKGCSVVGAGTAVSGIMLAQKEKPAVILIDAHLPDSEGLDVLRRIRSFDKEAKVFLYSGLYNQDLEEEAVSAGASGFIDKASSIESIINVIVSAIGQ